MIDDEFYPPPECPVFEPSEEEFGDPLGYINKIRPIAEKAGICKIRPPPHWQPPFAIDVENFKFTPRVQRINELGVHTRIRLQFIERIAKFWDLQGTAFKLPHVGGKALDLYGLHDAVSKLGGFMEVCKTKQWNNVCVKLGLQKNFGTVLRQHYEKILYPYDIMKSGVLVEALESDEKRADIASQLSLSQMKRKKKTMYQGSSVSLEDLDLFKASQTTLPQELKPKCKRRPLDEPLVADVKKNKELAKLQLYGAGPKMLGLGLTAQDSARLAVGGGTNSGPAAAVPAKVENVSIKTEPGVKEETNKAADDNGKQEAKDSDVKLEEKPKVPPPVNRRKPQTRNKASQQIPYSIIDSIDNCKMCGKDSNDSLLLLCDGCDDSYHTYCLIPPLSNVPTGDWRCPKCIAKECNKKMQAYGFEQARKEYSLQSFGEMADTFKSEYFNKPVHMVPTEAVEREFWRLVGSLEEDLTVEYGADIHVVDHGSGFPRTCDAETRKLSAEEEEYAVSPWNLNNLPVQEQSLLRSVSGDISGMKIPWVYVGMCFSAFCWHIEDHWTYSINYLHWGEPKTWYGVPREDAERLETVMQESAPELFKNYPDLLHHLVTTMNPTTLMKNNVRVVRTNQCAGEFMITFPRAYHAGFNQGYNFAEAVNFCPADWVPIGRLCIDHYRKLRKHCVFSHEEIVCKVAHSPENLDVQVAAVIYRDLVAMTQKEKELRKSLMQMGVSNTEREAFELVPDDERQCCYCLTTCFLSAVTCPCSPDKLACLHHVDKLCDKCQPSQFVLRYRYSLDELPPILHKLKQRAEAFDNWSDKVREALTRTDEKLSLGELKILVTESDKGKFPENDTLQRLKSAIHEAEMCSRVAQQLVNTRKHRRRLKDPTSAPSCKGTLTLEEIQAFHKQLQCLPCKIEHMAQVTEYVTKIEKFIMKVEEGLKVDEPSSEEMLRLLEDSTEFDLDLPQIPLLHEALQQAKWLEGVRRTLLLDDDVSSPPHNAVTLEQLRKLIDSGVSVAPRSSVEHAMAELQELLTLAESWEEKARLCLNTRAPVPLTTAVQVKDKADQIPVFLPLCNKLSDAVKKAQSWLDKVKKVQNQDYYPYLEVLEMLTSQARPMSLQLEQVDVIEGQVASAKTWKERTAKIFLKKNSLFSLFEVLTPRSEPHASVSLRWRKRKMKELSVEEQAALEKSSRMENVNMNDPPDPNDVVEEFKKAEERELKMIVALRHENDLKVSQQGNPAVDDPPNPADDRQKPSSRKDETIYCICQKPSSGFMLQCEVCHDWFHTSCVPLPKLNNAKSKLQQVYELKFLCPLCRRSRRPHLSTILTLLLQLQRLPVRIKEGEALQCATERAMAWQDRARKVVAEKECQEALKRASHVTGEAVSDDGKQHRKSQKKRASTCIEGDGDKRQRSSTQEGRNSIDEAIDAVIQNTMERSRTPVAMSTEGVDQLLSAATQAERRFSSQSENSDARSTEDVMEAAEALAMIGAFSSAGNHGDRALPGNRTLDVETSQTPTTTSSAEESLRLSAPANVQSGASDRVSQADRTISPNLECQEKMKESPEKDKNPIESAENRGSSGTSSHKQATSAERETAAEQASGGNESPTPHSAVSDTSTEERKDKGLSVDEKCDEEKVTAFIHSTSTPPADGAAETETECHTPATLSDDMKRCLESLMLEGDLLEVTLPETQTIWRILQSTQPIKDKNFIELLEKEQKGSRLAEGDNEKKKRKKDDQSATDKKKKKQKPAEDKEKKDKVEKKKKKKESKQAIVAAAIAGVDDDEFAICSVEVATCGRQRCLQPIGEQVNWVQCDGGCEEWFHCVCVDISASEARDSEYICEACKNMKFSSELGVSRQTSDVTNMDVDVTSNSPVPPTT